MGFGAHSTDGRWQESDDDDDDDDITTIVGSTAKPLYVAFRNSRQCGFWQWEHFYLSVALYPLMSQVWGLIYAERY